MTPRCCGRPLPAWMWTRRRGGTDPPAPVYRCDVCHTVYAADEFDARPPRVTPDPVKEQEERSLPSFAVVGN